MVDGDPIVDGLAVVGSSIVDGLFIGGGLGDVVGLPRFLLVVRSRVDEVVEGVVADGDVVDCVEVEGVVVDGEPMVD